MSKISIKPNDSGAGTFTIESPASNTNRSFLLPDEGGTVLTTSAPIPAENVAGNFNIDSGTISSGVTFPPGTIIQTKHVRVDERINYSAPSNTIGTELEEYAKIALKNNPTRWINNYRNNKKIHNIFKIVSNFTRFTFLCKVFFTP